MDKYTADMVFSECDRSKTGSDKFYEFKYNDLQGQEVSLRNYTNHVTLIVNVASFWGLTKQNYEELNALLDEYGGEDACSLKVIAFPSGQFMNEEPGEDYELLNLLKYIRPGNGFIPTRYLDFSQKIDVNGDSEVPLFAWLKDMCARPNRIIATSPIISWRPIKSTDVKWNFEKWLLDHEGMPRKRYTNEAWPNDVLPHIQELRQKCQSKQKDELKEVLGL